MKVYTSLNDLPKLKKTVVTIGTFDGVHIGHRRIIERIRDLAAERKGESVILTFFPHPRMVLYPDDPQVKLLNTVEEKIDLMRKHGVDNLIIHPFSREFADLTYKEFVRNILVRKIGAGTLVIGYDHHFGKNRQGGFEELKALAPLYGFDLEEIPEQDVDNVAVSSTKIRNALLIGDISTAGSYLGHDYSITGKVVKGRQLGRSLGFPTANLEVKETYKLIPANGIYAVLVELGKEMLKGMMSIGFNPTVSGKERTIEVNIFDFDKDIYNKNLRVFFKARLRDEIRFGSLEELKAQMIMDKEITIKILS
jgi:riboflavin kinase / FMN adenylyltransferase